VVAAFLPFAPRHQQRHQSASIHAGTFSGASAIGGATVGAIMKIAS